MAYRQKKYSLGNSLSPMMFRKDKATKGEKEALSRSLDDLLTIDGEEEVEETSDVKWPEVAGVRKVAPVVMCVLPPTSMDLVCSALCSAGATPLITDNELDVVKDLRNCRAVVVDVSAPATLIEAVIECYDPTSNKCLVVAATQAGSNDRKRDLAVQLIDKCGPSLVTGRLADIYALGQIVTERVTLSDDDDEESPGPQISIERIQHNDSRKASEPAVLPSHTHRKANWRKPLKSLGAVDQSPRSSPRHSPRGSPHTSPQSSPRHSFVTSPNTHSPRASPSGVRKKMKGGRKIGRAPTLLPRVNMKGQFQDNSMLEVNVGDAFLYGQKLAAHMGACIYLYETSVVTNGEKYTEILNPQPGMKNLHSLLPCSAAIAAACVSSAPGEDDIEDMLRRFSHSLAFWCVAVEEAGNHANQKGRVLPGTMRQALIDALHYLKESHISSSAKLSTEPMSVPQD